MNRIAARISRLEHLLERHAREPGQLWWWELPDDQWHLGAIGLTHEEALALLDTEPDAEGEPEGDAA